MADYLTELVGSDYAKEFGFIGYDFDAAKNFSYISPWDLLPNPISRHIEMSGWGGWGMDFAHAVHLWPLILFAIFFFNLRKWLYGPFKQFGIFLGIAKTSHRKLQKFQYQMWLLMYYVLSTIFGAYVLWDKPWSGFPMNSENMMSLFVNHPAQPENWITWYYCYEMGFFVAEFIVIFQETRRSDFMEYVIHHITTLALMLFSYVGYEHRIGSYILIIHDVSDIFLCFTKILHYTKAHDLLVNTSFAIFMVIFVYARLVCLPVHGFAVLLVGTGKRIATVNFWFLTILLQFVLQGLHVYWFFLIARMLHRLVATDTRGDVRSSGDDDDAPSPTVAAPPSETKKVK